MHSDPETRLRDQALRLRRRWQQLSEEERAALADRLRADALGEAWREVLACNHPFRDWLDGSAPWPPTPTMSPSPRELVTSHPVTRGRPWSSPATSV